MKKNKKNKKPFVKEQSCLNCGANLSGAYCASCGQKAFLNKESFWHLAYEFTADYFHYDGKFISTIKALFLKPGVVTKEFIEGRRKKYLNPIPMYLFVSALLILLLVKFADLYNDVHLNNEQIIQRHQEILVKRDSVRKAQPYKSKLFFILSDMGYLINQNVFTLKEYDSLEKSLPAAQQEHGIKRFLHRRALHFNDTHLYYDEELSKNFIVAFIQTLPKVLFILLPLFAWIVRLFYKRYPFFDHLIFSLHFHAILVSLLILFFSVAHFIDSEILSTLWNFVIIGLIFLYLFLSLRKVFPGNWIVSTLKFLAIATLYIIFFGSFSFLSFMYNMYFL